MRFSVLAVEISSQQAAASRDLIHDIAEFAARENVSCILMSVSSGSGSGADSVARNLQTCAHAVADGLRQLGLRYETVTSQRSNSGSLAAGSAVLTQLSLLATVSPPETEDSSRRPITAGRLAVAPHSVIDAYAVASDREELSHNRIETLLSLIEATDEILDRGQTEKPRRRGPIRRGPKVGGEPVRTRFVCVAGPSDLAANSAGKALSEAKLTNVTERAGFAPAIFVRPAIKPVATKTVTLSVGGDQTEHASFVAFDL